MIDSIILYFQFFTRIPIPIHIEEPAKKMREGVRYFTLFGLLIGLLEAVIFLVLHYLLNVELAWIMVLFFDVVLTGGFHLDALADMADGLFSSRSKERMLEIMKDSRVGSNGILAMIFYYLLMIFAFYTLLPQTTFQDQLVIVLLMNLMGKNGISLLFYQMNYAGDNPKGLGATFLAVETVDIGMAQLFSLIILLIFLRGTGIICFLVNLLTAFLYRKLVLAKVDGFNGDTLGACSPISQVIFLLTLNCVGSWL